MVFSVPAHGQPVRGGGAGSYWRNDMHDSVECLSNLQRAADDFGYRTEAELLAWLVELIEEEKCDG